MNSVQDGSKIIILMEKNLNLFEQKLFGIPYWWFARDRVFAYLFSLKSDLEMTINSAESLTYCEVIKKILDSFHINRIRDHNILSISTSSARRMVVNGKDFDVYTDFISWTSYKDQYAVIETPDLIDHSKRPYSPARYYGDFLSLRGNLARLIFSFYHKYKHPKLKEVCSGICNYLIHHHDIHASEEKLLEIIAKEAAFAKAAVETAGKYIDRIRPEVMLVECGYSPSHMVFQYAAKKRKIPVIEIQHGLIVQSGLGYFFGLESSNQLDDSPFPDKIIVFGEHFKRCLKNNPFINQDDIFVLGHPIIHWMKEKYGFQNKKNGRIIVCTQPELHSLFVDLILELSRRVVNEIIIKPHPIEVSRKKQLYGKLEGLDNVSFAAEEENLYELFLNAEYHVSGSSMTQLEAICFGLKSILIETDSFLGYLDFMMEMGLPVASDVETVIKAIESYPDIKTIRSYVSSEIFSLDKNPIKEIESLLGRYLP